MTNTTYTPFSIYLPENRGGILQTLKISDNLVEVDGKPYSIVELYIQGEVSGSVSFDKIQGVRGRLIVHGDTEITLEPPGILVVGLDNTNIPRSRIEVYESRRELVVRSGGERYICQDISIVFDKSTVAISISYSPRRLVVYHDPRHVVIHRKPYSLNMVIRSPSVEAPTKVGSA